jgi:hypothetical protein
MDSIKNNKAKKLMERLKYKQMDKFKKKIKIRIKKI